MEVNGIAEEQFTVIEGNLIDDRKIQELVGYGTCDMVVANILAEVLVPLTPESTYTPAYSHSGLPCISEL